MKNTRIQNLKILFLERKKITNKELCDLFGVSIETVRRDLNELEEEGFLKKRYGGAQLVEVNSSPDEIYAWDVRMSTNNKSKQSIGAVACSLIPDGSTIFVDSGTTLYQASSFLKAKKNLTIITNNIRVASDLGMLPNISLYFIGGLIKPDILATSGVLSTEFLEYFYHIDYYLISSDGFIPDRGTTEYFLEFAMFKKKVIEKSSNIIAIVDHSKMGLQCNATCCPVNKIKTLVTDCELDEKSLAKLKENNVEVIVTENY